MQLELHCTALAEASSESQHTVRQIFASEHDLEKLFPHKQEFTRLTRHLQRFEEEMASRCSAASNVIP